ncbi:magnesium protoporphyrin IX methyltransferase [Bradyrhizobium sp.]|uniref:magnesium protoporphyrin IX methyltransferase n=1 Tax=Bradyrhizobium sp. TaxID=376 RepID=UPI003C46CBE4
MSVATYLERRGELQTYFDRTAVDAWSRLTSDAPVGRIRATVRAGRDEMRNTLLSWLPANLSGARLLDAGCGTGALSIEAARRGARVVAIDLSPTLVSVARERIPADLDSSTLDFRSGDMLDPRLGTFDFVVAMDSLIHYRPADICRIVAGLAMRTNAALLVTFAPRTAALSVMHAVGGLFPRGDRAPAIEPVAEQTLRRLLLADENLERWQLGRGRRVANGFYISHALEMIPR